MSALEQHFANMTVAELADFVGVDVGVLVALVLERKKSPAPKAVGRPPGRGGRKAAAKAETGAQTQAAGDADGHNTRTKSGRGALDESILAFLKSQSEPVRALDIRRALGGTSAQIRTRLNVLIADKKVQFKGRASGTRYWVK